MEGIILSILIFIGVMAVTLLVFGIWLAVTIIRGVARGFTHLIGGNQPATLPQMGRGIACSNPSCRAPNPGTARFCRRCGRELPQAQRVSVRRAAMW